MYAESTWVFCLLGFEKIAWKKVPQVVVKDGDEIHMMDPIHLMKSECFKGGRSQKKGETT